MGLRVRKSHGARGLGISREAAAHLCGSCPEGRLGAATKSHERR